jgi:hypothetical protein
MAVANSIALLNLLINHINTGNNKKDDDIELYNEELIDKTKYNEIYMNISTILKNYPTIMKDATISSVEYKSFSDELKDFVLGTTGGIVATKNKSFCDLILFDILCRMKLDIFKNNLNNNVTLSTIQTNFDNPSLNTVLTIGTINKAQFIKNNFKTIETIQGLIDDFSIPMNKKIKLYKIIKILFNVFYEIPQPLAIAVATPIAANRSATITAALTVELTTAPPPANASFIEAYVMFDRLIKDDEITCAPRTIIEGYRGGKKSNNIEYHICKANFKHTFKKVSAKSARECAKKIAKKVLIGNKKSVKFSLKRMIGNKEKCYDYIASIEKGKIVIKNQ